MKRHRLVLAVWLALAAAVAPCTVAAKDPYEPLRREAINLFERAFAAGGGGASRCALRDAWLDYSIPEDIARQHLGLTIHANLVPPEHKTSPAEVIDPNGRMPDAFCSDAEAKRRQDELVEDFRKSPPGAAAEEIASRPRLVISHTEYTFPVFSADYRRAIIVVARTSFFWTKPSADEVKAIGLETGGVAEIFVRRGRGGWRLLAREPLFSGH